MKLNLCIQQTSRFYFRMIKQTSNLNVCKSENVESRHSAVYEASRTNRENERRETMISNASKLIQFARRTVGELIENSR